MKYTAKKIAYLALITAISVIMNTLTLTVPGSGIAISFTYIPNFLAGYYFGPGAGFIVGVIGDVLGCIIWPKGAWLPLLTLSAGLMGAIPGLVRYLPLKTRWHILISYIETYLICSAGLNTFTLWQAYAATKKTFWVYLIGKMPVSVANMIANLVINFMLMPVFDRIITPRIREVRTASGEKVAVVEGVSVESEEVGKDPND